MNGNPHLPLPARAAPPAAHANSLHAPTTASPGASPGHTPPTGPNGKPLRARKRRPQTDPLRPVKRPLKQIAKPMVSLTEMNNAPAASLETPSDGTTPLETLRHEYLAKGAHSLPLTVTRKDLKELRHHVMRLHQSFGKGKVDILNKDQFTQPIRLHRRDPRAPPGGAGAHLEDDDTKEDVEEAKERERLEMAKEERRKTREENQAKIAPAGAGVKKSQAFQKKTEQKFRPDDTPEAIQRRLLRYEETLPWHLEDFDNKQTWVGTYESELSGAHVMLTTSWANGKDSIQLIPLERWYKFQPRSKVKQFTEEEIENYYKGTSKMPKFLSNIEQLTIKREQQEMVDQRKLQLTRGRNGQIHRSRVGGGDDDEGGPSRGGDEDGIRIKREIDADDIDYNLEDDFADDEEGVNGLFEGEEADVKDATERLKRDHLGAAAFDLRNEDEVHREEEREREEAENQRKLEKALRKALIKREKNADFEESDNSNPYASSSESETDSETERQRAKEEEEKKAAEQAGKTAEAVKGPSGASTKGTTTPSGVHKAVDANKKKRPGSPNLSEASGNESSRKKHKKKHHDGPRKSSLAHLSAESARRGPGSGSESEMTDAGKKKKKHNKLKLGVSPHGSPSSSRAGSPAASQVNGSRAGSPTAGGLPSALTPATPKVLPSASEIYHALPAEGMTIQNLINRFKTQVDKSNTQNFIKLVKAVSVFDKARSWLTPLPQMPTDEHVNSFMRGGHKAAKK
ncbi:hypothetical protein P154DRAFT_529400 [Amniculicola lignicola CBS 123094]|uniref:Transcription initiation factor IIF subunit alpha n=1 Tax=Amniculicola lignicola CBS 123094 TaxID=1392246 RepID=A0A6A5X0Y0_9PLEO|nr:hypothetical protein P154DRAFT_529400 [Amniculicola lignicola CBS 123094]